MKVLIVVAHPDKNSIELKNIVPTINMSYKKKGYDVTIINLYNDGYNPSQFVGDISNINNNAFAKSYRNEVKLADKIFIVSSTRWLTLNPLLEGWIDQVFIKGFAFNQGTPLFKRKKLTIITTSNLKGKHRLLTLNLLWIRLRLLVFPQIFGWKGVRMIQLWGVKDLTRPQINVQLKKIQKRLK